MGTGCEVDEDYRNTYKEKEIKNIKEENTYFEDARS
jgi:hypothetical protein